MKLSTRARYGTRAMLDLAQHYGEEVIPLKDIARRQQISLPYLEHLVGPLVDARLIQSVRGARGGLKLAKSPESIRLSEVVSLLEGSIEPVDCVHSPDKCHRSRFCATRDIWDDVGKAMTSVLEQTTLADLVAKQRAKMSPEAEMYYI
ncbi:RrF2 family transcriptional regulator [Dehalogenimonas alkenigignens]|uniref:Transcriptional regulator, BadM/Rrf2 family n=1 Tax=Dehalogenimonas alkenigignens TaxID=1217799 RepID=A0A0W0GI62_9CHLR|nr:Rrf2 family transcriptional regulator [Dehalogenimonas alkenigignens]KTB48269.1 transcriptional regulator, BadM/Rrf2 family [Dehalogenimonas alkenigignens]PVV84500.1 Rrf2 family transcriptional regulator [Dehalogenimonas alkenigignens]